MTIATLVERAYEAQLEGRTVDADLDIGAAVERLVRLIDGSQEGARRLAVELADLPREPLALLTTAALQALALGRLGAL